MKRIKSILTVLMAAVFALSLVPVQAFAQDPINVYDIQVRGADPTTIANHNVGGQTGVLGTQHGTMTIANAKANETYNVYRLFELASFDDEDVSTGVHGTEDKDEAYSYVINNDGNNKWYTFLTTQQPVGVSVSYAVLSNAETGEGTDGIYTLEEAAQAGYYFVIDAEPITIKGANGTTDVATYHVITPTSLFSHAGASGNRDDMGDATDRTNEGVSAGDDYVATTNSNKVVQDFAQQALKYAEANGISPVKTVTAGSAGGSTALLTSADAAPLGYYLVGTSMGTLAAIDTTNKDVTVYEKNDEPTVEKAILKKGEAFDATDYEDLVGKSAASRQKAIDEAQAAVTAAQAAVTAATAAVTDASSGSQEEQEAAASALATAQAGLVAAQTNLANATNAADPVWVKDTDADLEDYVVFRTVVTAQQGAKDYVLHDVMEQGLELVTSEVASGFENDRHGATINPDAPKVYLVRGQTIYTINATGGTGNAFTNYVLTTGTDVDPADGCDFEIEFKDATVGAGVDNDNKVVFKAVEGDVDVKDGDKIVVVYWAKISDSEEEDGKAALWGDEGTTTSESSVLDNSDVALTDQQVKDRNGNGRNDNYTVLTYGAKSRTQWDKASATVYELDIAKTDAYDVGTSPDVDYSLLKGAKFRLYKATTKSTNATESPATEIGTAGVTLGTSPNQTTYNQESKALLFDEADGFDENAPVYRFAGDVDTDAVSATPAGKQLVTGKGKSMRLEGLEAGHYILVEEEAPAGYNKLAHPIVVTITGDTDSDGLVSTDNGYEDDSSKDGYDGDEGCLSYGFKANDGSEQTGGPVAPQDTLSASLTGVYRTTDGTNTNGALRVVNQTGQELPSTGGIGTTIFYVAGTVLVVGAAVMLVAKRRMGAEA